MFYRYTDIGKKDVSKLGRFNGRIGTFKDYLDLVPSAKKAGLQG